MLAAVASPRRREILRLVWSGEQRAGAIHRAMPDVTFGAVSLHLKALADAGLVDVRVDGRWRAYRARRDALGPIAGVLERMWDDALWRLKLQAELEQTRRGPKGRQSRARKRGRPRRRPAAANARTTPGQPERRTTREEKT
jgi:DNA-binding transcriptional ArsR family regulator